jgi:hypothetical protein
MAPNAGVSPCSSKRAGNAVAVQVNRNRLRAFARCKFLEDAADGVGFFGDDFPVAPDWLAIGVQLLQNLVAVAKPTACFALLHPAPKAAMRLHGEVFQEQRVHRAFQADMKLGDFPFRQRGDGDACEFQMLVEGGNVCLIAADAVQRLGQEDVELAMLRIAHQSLDARTQDRAGPGNGRILIGTDDLPPLPLRMFATQAKLILNRGFALVVGGIAGVKGCAGHGGLRSVSP